MFSERQEAYSFMQQADSQILRKIHKLIQNVEAKTNTCEMERNSHHIPIKVRFLNLRSCYILDILRHKRCRTNFSRGVNRLENYQSLAKKTHVLLLRPSSVNLLN